MTHTDHPRPTPSEYLFTLTLLAALVFALFKLTQW